MDSITPAEVGLSSTRLSRVPMRRFIIDTDAGVDDAVALMMALRHPDVQVEAITTVAGNVGVEQATRNALYIAELCAQAGAGAADVPIYQGMGRPMLRQPSNARSIHGEDGLGDLGLDPPKGRPQAEHAVDALIRYVMAVSGEITNDSVQKPGFFACRNLLSIKEYPELYSASFK